MRLADDFRCPDRDFVRLTDNFWCAELATLQSGTTAPLMDGFRYNDCAPRRTAFEYECTLDGQLYEWERCAELATLRLGTSGNDCALDGRLSMQETTAPLDGRLTSGWPTSVEQERAENHGIWRELGQIVKFGLSPSPWT